MVDVFFGVDVAVVVEDRLDGELLEAAGCLVVVVALGFGVADGDDETDAETEVSDDFSSDVLPFADLFTSMIANDKAMQIMAMIQVVLLILNTLISFIAIPSLLYECTST